MSILRPRVFCHCPCHQHSHVWHCVPCCDGRPGPPPTIEQIIEKVKAEREKRGLAPKPQREFAR